MGYFTAMANPPIKMCFAVIIVIVGGGTMLGRGFLGDDPVKALPE